MQSLRHRRLRNGAAPTDARHTLRGPVDDRWMLRFRTVLLVSLLTLPAAAAPPDLPAAEAVYPWRAAAPAGASRLDGRFPAPHGFTRVPAASRSFGAFLRSLPLAPEGTKVLDYAGRPLYEDGYHPNIAAVVDIDVGTRNLQQCADAVIRLNAEWRYGLGERDIAYRAVSGQRLAYESFLAGDRAVVHGTDIAFTRLAAPHADDHAFFRGWLDDVFGWAGTGSLARDARKVERTDLAPGDLFVMTGTPFGHTVLVLDVAKDEHGRVALLLGQGYMPAQSFQVLRPDPRSTWFVVEPTDTSVTTPFWRAFPLDTSLKRL